MIIIFFLQNNSLCLIRKMFTNRTMIKDRSKHQASKGFLFSGLHLHKRNRSRSISHVEILKFIV